MVNLPASPVSRSSASSRRDLRGFLNEQILEVLT
jgi:hypothetical protein